MPLNKKNFFTATAVLLILAVSFLVFIYVNAFTQQETKENSKTVKFFIFQSPVALVSPTSTSTDFSIFIGEKSPITIRDAYIELRGVTQASINQQITVDFKEQGVGSFPTNREQQFILDSRNKQNNFKLYYIGKEGGLQYSILKDYLASLISGPGTYSFTFKIDINGTDISLFQARMVITYQFTPPSAGAYPISGTFYSSIFDTGAANGASFNKIMAKGPSNPGTKVRVQFAASSSTDPNSFTFIGPSPECNPGAYFYDSDIPQPNVSKEIGCYAQHNNKRYFRYKVILCSGDCSSAGSITPQVDDVIVNWSP